MALNNAAWTPLIRVETPRCISALSHKLSCRPRSRTYGAVAGDISVKALTNACIDVYLCVRICIFTFCCKLPLQNVKNNRMLMLDLPLSC